MRIGVPSEIKTNENRVAVVPAGVEAMVGAGHEVLVERSAGEGSGFDDAAYAAAGAKLIPAAAVFVKPADLDAVLRFVVDRCPIQNRATG